jgi:hypothetical protein
MIIPTTTKMTISACVQIQTGDTYLLAWSWRLIAAIVRLIRALIDVVALTSADCARSLRCGEPVANSSLARWIARP